jgi:hypothetical protein
VSNEMPWRRVGVEAAAVVGSILLAFAIDSGWDARQEGVREAAAVDALRIEMEQNRAQLIEDIGFNDRARGRVSEFLTWTSSEIEVMTPETLGRVAVDLWAPFTYDPRMGATVAFLERGPPSTPRGRVVHRAVTDWDRQLSDAGEESTVLWEASRRVLFLLTPHIADLVPTDDYGLGLGLIDLDLTARLAAIRDDETVIASTIAKFNLQAIYTGELRRLLASTDSIIILLREDGS